MIDRCARASPESGRTSSRTTDTGNGTAEWRGSNGNPERSMEDDLQRDAELRQILDGSRTIAVVGIKAGETDDAYRVPKYMQDHGYRIVPVNPKLETVLGETAFRDLAAARSAGNAIDVVNLFRASDQIPGHVDEILTLSPPPRAVWMQLGIQHGPSAARLRAAGIVVVQDRCIMVDHRRLIGAEPPADVGR